MEITSEELEWTSENQAIWRDFLKTVTGKRLLPKLLEAVPPLLASGDANAILIRNGEVRGFQLASRTLLELAFPPRPAENAPETYPDLFDDGKWNDGQKIEPQN